MNGENEVRRKTFARKDLGSSKLSTYYSWQEARDVSLSYIKGNPDDFKVDLIEYICIPTSDKSRKGGGEIDLDAATDSNDNWNRTEDEKKADEVIERDPFKLDSIQKIWISEKTMKLATLAFAAHVAVAEANTGLITSIRKIIRYSRTFGEVSAVWPEALDIEKDLFPYDDIPKGRAIVSLSDNDRRAICENMKERKVPGAKEAAACCL